MSLNMNMYSRIPDNLSSQRKLMRSTAVQINMVVDYMAANKDFANNKGIYGGVIGAQRAAEEWEALRLQLKQHGCDKTVLQWKQTWRDLKRKARCAVRRNRGHVPVVSNAIFKILDTIGSPHKYNTTDVEEVKSPLCEELCEWEEDSENSVVKDNENKSDKTRHMNVDDSDASSTSETADSKDESSLLQIMVPLQQDFTVGSSSKTQQDPLQAPQTPTPILPRTGNACGARPAPAAERTRLRHQRRLSASPLRRRMLFAQRRTQNMFIRTSNNLLALEERRLRMDEERDRRLHEREMERLKIELQRIEVQRNQNELLQHLVTVAQNAYELLQRNLQ